MTCCVTPSAWRGSVRGSLQARLRGFTPAEGVFGATVRACLAADRRSGRRSLMSTHDEGIDRRERPLGEVASELTRDLGLLVRQEVELAKAEMREKGRTALPGIGMIGGAGAVALCAAGATTAFLILALATFLDSWLAALLVAVLLSATAAVLALAGKERVEEVGSPLPEETIDNVKEDAQWLKEQASSARR